jgi:hypothetical protein
VDAVSVGAAERTRGGWGGHRQHDGQGIDVQDGVIEATAVGSREEFERKQEEAPEMRDEMDADGEGDASLTMPDHRECGRARMASS